ncbi:MAG: SGNH/GDSL hydrolase family protein [Legionellaceae bacterium]|nr:SGNH/GDSL hydrolase family protein [Legionellaceae bacterium]
MKYTTLIVGDSLACARPWEGVDLHSTYATQLQKILGANHTILNVSAGENTTKKSTSKKFFRTYINGTNPHFAIIHLGIVDCAPRLMSNFERLIGAITSRLPFFRNLFKAYAKLKGRHRFFLTKLFPMTLIPKNIFQKNYKYLIYEILKNNNTKKIYLINIASPGSTLLMRSYGIQENIKAYNAVIEELHQIFQEKTIFIDLYDKTYKNPHWITSSDGHHIKKPAHDWLADTIGKSILSILNTDEMPLSLTEQEETI